MLLVLKKTIEQKKIKLFGSSAFDPLTFDVANLLALYDGDLNITPLQWRDQSANAYDLTLFNAPTVVPAAINGHQALRFDGINQYGTTVNFARPQPYTFYLVLKQITWVNGATLIDNVAGINQGLVYQIAAPTWLGIYAGNNIFTNPDNIPLNSYDILTCVFNGANGEIRRNNNAAILGNNGPTNTFGISMGARITPSDFFNGEIAYCILRNGADNTATQNLFINWLKNRFAL